MTHFGLVSLELMFFEVMCITQGQYPKYLNHLFNYRFDFSLFRIVAFQKPVDHR